MNKKKREKLSNAISHLRTAKGLVDTVLDDEEDCLSNIPEAFESTDRYEKIENAIQKLEEASEKIEEATDCLAEASS